MNKAKLTICCVGSPSTVTFIFKSSYMQNLHHLHPCKSNSNPAWVLYGNSDAQTIKHTLSCILVQDNQQRKTERQHWREVELRGRQKKWWRKPVRERYHWANPSQADLTSRHVRLTTGQGCLWLSHRRNGWKGLWCWSCSAWLQNENMELLVSQPMTVVGNH